MINVFRKSRINWILVFTGIALALCSVSAVFAEVDTSSCDSMGEKKPIQIWFKNTCYLQLAKRTKDMSVCSGAPDPTVCIGAAAEELENPELITANLEGEARETALAAYAISTDPDALDLIKDNRIHDFAVISLIGTFFISEQLDDKIGLAMPKIWCNSKLKGNYEGYEGFNQYGESLNDEFVGNKNLCNKFTAITRELAYEDESCDNWYASVYEGLESLENMNEASRAIYEKNPSMMTLLDTPVNVIARCNEGIAEFRSKMKKAGLPEVIVNSEEEALKKMGIDTSAPKWVLAETLINPKGEMTSFAGGGALDWWFPGKRYEGKTLDYTVNETSITMSDHHMDGGEEYLNVTFTASFTRPPDILTEGETIPLSATISGGGSVTRPRGSGIIFEYSANGVGLQDNSSISIDLAFQEKSINTSFIVPKTKEGGEIRIKAGLWNCAACRVEWVYKPQGLKPGDDTFNPPDIASQPIKGPESDKLVDELLSGIEEQVPPPDTIIRIIEMSGEVLIKHRDGGTEVATYGTDMAPWDTIITGLDSHVRIAFTSRDPDMPSVANIGEDTEIHLKDFEKDWKPEERGLIELIKGAFRAITRGWKRDKIFSIKAGTTLAKDPFSVKAGTTLCDIRGSEVLICYDKASKIVHAYVYEGHMDVSSTETGETKSLTDNQKVVVQNGILGDIQPLSQSERNFFTAGQKATCDLVDIAAYVIPDFTGKPVKAADEWLKDNNLMVTLKPGSVAPSPELSGAVEAQDPEAGTTLKKGEQVSLTVHSAFVDVSKVPDITGMKLADAQEALRKQGLETKLSPGRPAPSRDRSGTVESQDPAAGSTVEKGTKITLKVHSKYSENRTVPSVSGLSASLAKSLIAEAELKPVLKPGEAASSQKQAGTVSRQRPVAGMTVKPGSEVEVFVYGPYVAKTLPPRKDLISEPQAEEETIKDWIIGSEWGRGVLRLDEKKDGSFGTKMEPLPGRMKFVKDENRIVAKVLEEFPGNYCPQVGGICYEIIRKAEEEPLTYPQSTVEQRTFIARKFMKNGQSGFAFLTFREHKDRSGAHQSYLFYEGDMENENDYYPGKQHNSHTWLWTYRYSSAPESTDSSQSSGGRNYPDVEVEEGPIDSIGTFGQD